MKILVTGSKGQLGYELQCQTPDKYEVDYYDLDELDITNKEQVNNYVGTIRPHLIINAAAYTAVDKAEIEPRAAFAVNTEGAGYLAAAALSVGARFIHISTDFIFDGAASKPYRPDAIPAPLGVYGISKLEGEKEVLRLYGEEAVIIRTSWLYSAHGDNFVKTMLKLMRERESLKVVVDQIGSPTWGNTLASVIWTFAQKSELSGIYHCSDAGVASWYDFAVAIQDEAFQIGLLEECIPIEPVSTDSYKTPAKRPAYSVLDSTSTYELVDFSPTHWRYSLRRMLQALPSDQE